MPRMEKAYSDFKCVLQSDSGKPGCSRRGLLFGKELLPQGPLCVPGYPAAGPVFFFVVVVALWRSLGQVHS